MDDPKPLTGVRLYLLVRVEEKLEASAQSCCTWQYITKGKNGITAKCEGPVFASQFAVSQVLKILLFRFKSLSWERQGIMHSIIVGYRSKPMFCRSGRKQCSVRKKQNLDIHSLSLLHS